MIQGIQAAGDRAHVLAPDSFTGSPSHELAVFYGLEGKLGEIFAAYVGSDRRVVYIDLGYFGRREGGRFTGFHKISVNARHPTVYFQKPAHPADRLAHFRIEAQPRKGPGRHILVAGMSDKGAISEGFSPNQWELQAIFSLRLNTDRPIYYRPKPSYKRAIPLAGSVFRDAQRPLEEDLANCHAVVTHHSNVAVDALIAGIPAYCEAGVAAPLCGFDIANIDTPVIAPLEVRRQWLQDLAYTQWSIDELAGGDCWRHLQTEGLI